MTEDPDEAADPEDVEEVADRIRPILAEHGVQRAGLFGSVTRGELQPDSDIDVLVELPDEASILDLVALKQDLEDALGRTVDVVEYGTEHPRLRDRIRGEEVAIA